MTAVVLDTAIPDLRAPTMFNIRAHVQHYDDIYDEMGINVTCSGRTAPIPIRFGRLVFGGSIDDEVFPIGLGSRDFDSMKFELKSAEG
jgi:hypothetical protein